MNSTQQKFDYEKKKWGVSQITNLYTDFQGLQLAILDRDIEKFSRTTIRQVLDLGCGAGNIAAYLKKKYPEWEIKGLDISDESIKEGKKHFRNIKFIRSSADKIPLASGSLDMITSFDSLEHFDHLDKVLLEINRLLKNNGLFYLAVPLEKQFPTLYWFLYNLGWRGKKHFSGHVNFFSDASLIRKLQEYGFTLKKKRYSFHYLFSIFDIGYYFLQSLTGKPFAFETTISEMQGGIGKKLLSIFKSCISVIGYIESSLFFWSPGGKGHFVFIKQKKSDFFSAHPPLTVAEDYQQKYGLKKAYQPRDIEIEKDLNRFKIDQAKHILDFGCANGIWLERLLSNSKSKGTGIDIAENLISIANNRPEKKGFYFNSQKSWPKILNSVDFCFSFDTFEHIKEPLPEIKLLYNSLQKGAKFYFYTLNPKNNYTIDWFFEKCGSNYMYRRADHKKEMFIAPDFFSKMLIEAGFKKVKYKLYDGPFNLIWRVYSFYFLALSERFLSLIKIKFIMDYLIIFNDQILRFIYPLNQFLDGFFIRRGYSNGYFIWGEK